MSFFLPFKIDLAACCDLISCRMRRFRFIKDNALFYNPMLMGELQMGNFKQSITDTDIWLYGISKWPKKMRQADVMRFTRHLTFFRGDLTSLRAFRMALEPCRSYITLFALAMDLLMGGMESGYSIESYELVLRELPSTKTAVRGKKRQGRGLPCYEFIWVLRNDYGKHGYYLNMMSKVVGVVAGHIPTEASVGFFNSKTGNYTCENPYQIDVVTLDADLRAFEPVKFDKNAKLVKESLTQAPEIPKTPPPASTPNTIQQCRIEAETLKPTKDLIAVADTVPITVASQHADSFVPDLEPKLPVTISSEQPEPSTTSPENSSPNATEISKLTKSTKSL